MSDLPRSHLAVRQTRKLLINVGLREDEADAFLDRLSQEFAAGRLADETTQLEFIRRELAEIRQEQRKTPGRLENCDHRNCDRVSDRRRLQRVIRCAEDEL